VYEVPFHLLLCLILSFASFYLFIFYLLPLYQANNIGVEAPFQYVAEEFYRRLGLPLP
jgi:hypothetical protein